MPRGCRCIIIAAFGWLSLAAAPAPYRGAEGNQTAAAADIQRSLNSIASSQGKIAEATDTGEYEKPCAEGETNNNSDLCAQWHAARAARDAANWAYWALVVGLVGAAGIVAALLLTVDSNRIARDTARRQLRAYLTYGAVVADTEGPEWKVQIEWVNRGQTPAIKAETHTDWVALDASLPEDFDFPAPPVTADEGPMVVGPGQSVFAPADRSISQALLMQAAKGDKKIYVWSAVEYTDAFGKNRRTEMASKLSIHQVNPLQFSILFFALARHNNMDEHCDTKRV